LLDFDTGLLLARLSSDDGAFRTLSGLGLSDVPAAARLLRAVAGLPAGAAILPHLLQALGDAANPDRALINFERLVRSVPDHHALLHSLTADPHALEMLVTLFAGSQFLTDILLRDPEYYTRLVHHNAIAQTKSAFQFYLEAYRATCGQLKPGECATDPETLDGLRRHQHWELLRIGACDLTGLLDLASVTAQLSQLADSVIQVCLETLANGRGRPVNDFVVLGMGKLGGGELNYSSDVDLLFLAADNASACQRLGERLIRALTQATAEGFLYRVDMRLRPWGRVGPLISTVDGYLTYLRRHARLWEKQALLRARVIAGDEAVGRAFLRRAEPLLFEAGPEAVRAEVYAMKQLTEANLRQAGRTWGEVKLGEGSIRDAEFVAQYLQLAYGGKHAELRTTNTPEALARLAEAGFLSADDYRVLADGYTFLRTVEHYLQILDYRQTHTLPANPADLRYLARRLGFQGPHADVDFVTRYQQHSAAIRAVYKRHLAPAAENGSSTRRGVMTMQTSTDQPRQTDSDQGPSASGNQLPASSLREHVARLSPSYAATFSPAEIARHAKMAEQLGDRNPVEIAAEHLEGDAWRVTIVAYDYLGELSLICGLLFSYGLSIVDGNVFTYEPQVVASHEPSVGRDPRRKIVDVFSVRSVAAEAEPGGTVDFGAQWRRYATDLAALLRLLEGHRQREAQGELAKRVSLAVQGIVSATPTLHPIDIEVDNDISEKYTVLRIESLDTPGFLYEFSNALALNGIHIAQVSVISEGNRVRDTLFVTDTRGHKIADPQRQRELRAATVLVKHFTHLLPHSPNPESALLHFNEYLGELFARPSWPDDLASLERPEVLEALARLLGVSEFLWDDFLRMQYANLFPVVRDVGALAEAKSKEQLAAELNRALRVLSPLPGPGASGGTESSIPSGAQQGGAESSILSGAQQGGAESSILSGAQQGGAESSILSGAQQGGAESKGAPPRPPPDWRDVLNQFKDREMFRVDMRQILGLIPTFGQFSAELTDLTEVVLETTTRFCAEELSAQYGPPLIADDGPARLSLCALGKCGGRELGFASDIELMFIFDGGGQTSGPRVISAAEYYEKLVIETARAIRARREGIFEIDLQLRPYGKAGSLAVSLDSFRRYFAPDGPAWSYERQALVKLRPIAGDESLGREVIALRDAYVYSSAVFDVAAMRAMRERQIRHLVTPGTLNAKFSQGGLVDVEYIVQGLQITHGARDPSLRVTNTAAAIAALAKAGVISAENSARLGEALHFLQRLINALRMVRGNNKDLTVPPEESEEFAFLARRLGYGVEPGRLKATLDGHMGWVQRLGTRLLG